MKKLMLLLGMILFCSVTQVAGKVVMAPLSGTNVYVDPRNIVSAYYKWPKKNSDPSPHSPIVFLTVPANKHFVLTDIAGYAEVEILENAIPKIRVRVGGVTLRGDYQPYPVSITLSSGVVFGPETEVRAVSHKVEYYSENATYYFGHVTISGYYY